MKIELIYWQSGDFIPQSCEKVLEQLSEEERSNVARYTDYQKMLSEKHPQLVAIATESGEHARIAFRLLALA